MRGYSTKLDWHGEPEPGGWWVSLLKDGQEIAYMSLYEWRRLDATEQAIDDFNSDRAVAEADPSAEV